MSQFQLLPKSHIPPKKDSDSATFAAGSKHSNRRKGADIRRSRRERKPTAKAIELGLYLGGPQS